MKTIPADNPLTDAELESLEVFLKSRKDKDPHVMGLEELDGFLAALIAGPEMVLPSEYLPEVFGEAHVFETEEETKTILELIMRHWNAIAAALGKGEIHIPVFIEENSGVPRGYDWAHGFMHGVTMRYNGWRTLVEDEEHGGYVVPMMILDNEHNPDPELRPPPISPERRMDILGHMGAGLLLAYEYFKEQRRREGRMFSDEFDDFDEEMPEPFVRSEPKVGRNDPCPCGSGKKYKRCHGSVTVQ